MVAPTIPVSADSFEGSFKDMIDIGVDVTHPEELRALKDMDRVESASPRATIKTMRAVKMVLHNSAVVRTQAQHEEAIRGIHEQLLGVPIQEEMTALRFRLDIVKTKNASLRARIKTTEAIEKITRKLEKQTRIEIE
nr:hypothetical protein [Tanacetum cinerariifolium]